MYRSIKMDHPKDHYGPYNDPGRWTTKWTIKEGYIRTLIYVLSLVIRDQYSY